jgi:hypothetical protein
MYVCMSVPGCDGEALHRAPVVRSVAVAVHHSALRSPPMV